MLEDVPCNSSYKRMIRLLESHLKRYTEQTVLGNLLCVVGSRPDQHSKCHNLKLPTECGSGASHTSFNHMFINTSISLFLPTNRLYILFSSPPEGMNRCGTMGDRAVYNVCIQHFIYLKRDYFL